MVKYNALLFKMFYKYSSQTHSNFGKVDVDGGGLVLKMWICMEYLKK